MSRRVSKAYLSYIFCPSKHIHPICQSSILCLVVIDLPARSTTGLLYLHGWEGREASHQGDRWRPRWWSAWQCYIHHPHAAHPLIMSTLPAFSFLSLPFFYPAALFLVLFNLSWQFVSQMPGFAFSCSVSRSSLSYRQWSSGQWMRITCRSQLKAPNHVPVVQPSLLHVLWWHPKHQATELPSPPR